MIKGNNITSDASDNKYEPMIQKSLEKKQSRFSSYLDLFVGKRSFCSFIKYEILTSLFENCPGAAGILLRSIFYKFLFKKIGKGVVFGKSVTIRNPYKIKIGNNVIIDENAMIDAKGTDNNGIEIGDGAYIGRNSILSCKNGDIKLDKNVNIGFNCEIYSLKSVKIGENTLVAAYTYIIGGGHTAGDLDTPFRDQEKHAYGIEIGKNVWLGAKSIIMDGCSIGDSSIVGAGAVVNQSIPRYCIAAGIPAKIIKERKKE